MLVKDIHKSENIFQQIDEHTHATRVLRRIFVQNGNTLHNKYKFQGLQLIETVEISTMQKSR